MCCKRVYSFVLTLLVFTACSNKTKFNIEKHSDIEFKETYYQEWVSGIQGGGSGLNIFFVLNGVKDDELQLEGLYFRNEYAKLKYQEQGKYQGFIKTEHNWDNATSLEEDQIRASDNEKLSSEKEAFPFDLGLNEAVISYKFKNTIKYYKILLTKKETLDKPR